MNKDELQTAVTKFREYLIANGVTNAQVIVGWPKEGNVDVFAFSAPELVTEMLLLMVADQTGMKLVPK